MIARYSSTSIWQSSAAHPMNSQPTKPRCGANMPGCRSRSGSRVGVRWWRAFCGARQSTRVRNSRRATRRPRAEIWRSRSRPSRAPPDRFSETIDLHRSVSRKDTFSPPLSCRFSRHGSPHRQVHARELAALRTSGYHSRTKPESHMASSPRRRGRRAGTIVGSMSGLFTAAFLSRIGWDVDVFERSSIELVGRGAGITTHPELLEALEKCGAGTRDLGIAVPKRMTIDRQGRVIGERPLRQILTSWDSLQRLLREAVDPARYHLGHTFERVEQ